MTPVRQLATFIDRYAPEIARRARAVLSAIRKRVPGAVELVYDNYNALVIGFGPDERASNIVFSIALYPRWVTLFFLHGAKLPDPDRRLRGQGKQVRSVVLESTATLDEPAVRALMLSALARAEPPIDPQARRRLVIRAISPRQRPRRP